MFSEVTFSNRSLRLFTLKKLVLIFAKSIQSNNMCFTVKGSSHGIQSGASSPLNRYPCVPVTHISWGFTNL